MGTGERQWHVRVIGNVDLVLLPRGGMSWGQWGSAANTVWDFISDWESVALFFDVERGGVEERIGTGYIMKANT